MRHIMTNHQRCQGLLSEIRACRHCDHVLPHSPNPIVQASPHSKILIIGQAPGIRVHQTNIPWNDPSGDRLRQWLQLDKSAFYDPTQVAIIPMGFCYPGKGKSGDLPPRPECAPLWHKKILQLMPDIKLTLLIGQYAQNYYLEDKMLLTERVKNWREYWPEFVVLPHPSPRNNIWLKKNLWFEQELLPQMQQGLSQFWQEN